MNTGVVLTEHQSVSELMGLDAGTPIAVQVDGHWWAYISDGKDMVTPAGKESFDEPEKALQAAREHSTSQQK